MPDLDLRKLDVLKDRLVNGAVFADIMDYFFRNFGDKDAFMRLGVDSDCEKLKLIITRLAPELTRTKDPSLEFRFRRLPEYHFVHGAVLMPPAIGTAFYFEDIDRGLITIARPGGPTQFCRVSASLVRMPEDRKAN